MEPLVTLPLFPLHAVLFPGMPLPLYVFEERYRQMMRMVLEQDRQFGVVLIREGKEVGGPAVPYQWGTVARITALQNLPDGSMNLWTVGEQRFRIVQITQSEPFMVAKVMLLPDVCDGCEHRILPIVHRATDRLEQYVRLLFSPEGGKHFVIELPNNPRVLANTIGAILQVPLVQKQKLLEIDDVVQRLEAGLVLLEEEIDSLLLKATERAGGRAVQPFRPEQKVVSRN
ncbi:MAG: peptidase S16 [Armatimonadota bacterium]|nr:MAG: peptidase S16 [Armatimonadota bacterium]